MHPEAASAREGVPPATERLRTGRSALPDQRTLLSWLFVGRLVVAVGILLGAGLVWTDRPQESFLVTIAVLIALTFTAYGSWIVFVRNRRPGNTFLLFQAMVDLGVVTTIVHFAGQPQSAFPALYVLVVAAYALLMPPVWGAVTAVLASRAVSGRNLHRPVGDSGRRVLGADGGVQRGLRDRRRAGPPAARGADGAGDARYRAQAGPAGGR